MKTEERLTRSASSFSRALSYLQFFFNLSLVLIMLYLAVQFILTVKADISRKVEEASFGALFLSMVSLASDRMSG